MVNPRRLFGQSEDLYCHVRAESCIRRAADTNDPSGQAIKYCPQCGVAADPSARFCLSCGQELRKETGQVLPSAAVAPPSLQSTAERHETEGRGIAGWIGFGLGTLFRKARQHPYLALSTAVVTFLLLYWLSTAPTGLQEGIAAGNTPSPTAP